MSTASRCASALACVSLLYTSISAAAPPSIADFAADADFSFPALSPDGNKVAYVTRVQDQRILMVLDLVERKRIALMPAITESFEISRCDFKGNERLLCGFSGTASDRGQPYPVSRLVAIDASGKGKPRVLVQNGSQGSSQFQDRVLDWQVDDPKHVYIALSGDGDPFPNVHSLDVYTGLMTVVQRSRHPILRLDYGSRRDRAVRTGLRRARQGDLHHARLGRLQLAHARQMGIR